MSKGAKIWLELLGVKPGMEILVITDTTEMIHAGEVVARAAQELGAEVVVAIMSPRKFDNADPPRSIGEAIKGPDLVIPVARYNILHSKPVEDFRAARGHSKNFSQAISEGREKMMGEFHTTNDDLKKIKERSDKLVETFKDADRVKVTSPSGTDLTVSVKGKRWLGSGRSPLLQPDENAFKKYPLLPDLFTVGEVSCSPVTGSANGTYVVNAGCYMGGIGLVHEPIVWKIKDGRVIDISGGRDADRLKMIVQTTDKNAGNVAEIAFGISHVFKVPCGNTGDKAILGGMHVAVGTSAGGAFGGDVVSEIHEDGVSLNITVIVDGKTIMKDGSLLI